MTTTKPTISMDYKAMYESEQKRCLGLLEMYGNACDEEEALAENITLRSNLRWFALAAVVQFVALVLIGIWWWGQR